MSVIRWHFLKTSIRYPTSESVTVHVSIFHVNAGLYEYKQRWPPIVLIYQKKILSSWSILLIIDQKILVKLMDIDPSVHIQSIHRSNLRRNNKYKQYTYTHTYKYTYTYTCIKTTTDSIDPSIKHFTFLTNSIDHRRKIFSSSDDHRSNRYFLRVHWFCYRSNQCFFSHRCPPMPSCNGTVPSSFKHFNVLLGSKLPVPWSK